jgi:hypothetical protein
MPIQAKIDRFQTVFTSLEQVVAADNPVRFVDGFVEKIDLGQLSFSVP